jgi:hypothetical protein
MTACGSFKGSAPQPEHRSSSSRDRVGGTTRCPRTIGRRMRILAPCSAPSGPGWAAPRPSAVIDHACLAGLWSRRSRVRVPSLTLRKYLENGLIRLAKSQTPMESMDQSWTNLVANLQTASGGRSPLCARNRGDAWPIRTPPTTPCLTKRWSSDGSRPTSWRGRRAIRAPRYRAARPRLGGLYG